MEFVTKPHRRNSVFAHLIGAYDANEFPYTQYNLAKRPQDKVPPELRGNPNFWFYLCHLMRGMLKSDYATALMVKLYNKHPQLFEPEYASKLTLNKIQKLLEEVFPSVPKHQRYAEAWLRNSEILQAWGGNILNVYKGITTESEIRDRVINKRKYSLPLKQRGFFCFKAKMCSLLTYFLMDAKLIAPIRMSPPIDFHHMRAMVGTGIIPLEEGRYRPSKLEKVADGVGRAYLDRFSEMDPVQFADLLFVLSREGCAQAVSDPQADWSDPRIRAQYHRSCGLCPVEHLCQMTVLQDSYYTKGDVRTRVIHVVPRPKPPSRSKC